MAHAYIFFGPAGVGKKTAALNFAKAANCLRETDDGPCGACASCVSIDRMSNPDVFLVSPEEENRRASDKASVRIDRLRELIKDINLRPYAAKKKFYIIDGAHLMTAEASNAVLKTLEEPPSDSVLILITDQIEKLPQTIRSRSQVVRFFPLRVGDVRDILAGEHAVEDAEARLLANLSSGRVGEALRFRKEGLRERREAVISGLLKGDFFDSDFEGASREKLKFELDMMLTWFRDVLIAKAGLGDDSLINVDRVDAVAAEARRAGFDYLFGAIDRILATSASFDRSANLKLAMSVLGIKINGG
jgi:DNA polymerase-3 subunit delta'